MVEAGNALPRALSEVFAVTAAPPASRGAIQDLAYRSMRNWGSSKALLNLMADSPPQQPRLATLILCALALLNETPPYYAAHTVVDQAVAAADADRTLSRAKGLVNAILRRFLREKEALLRELADDPEFRWNYPAWWIDQCRTAWPDQWQSILFSGNSPPPLTLRVNQRKSSIADYMQLLTQHGIAHAQVGPLAVRLVQPVPVSRIPGFAEGLVSVQDAAAQLAAPLLSVEDGMHVLDACAAPGGKTGHLLESADVSLLALDQDAERLKKVADNLARLHLQATLITGDAASQSWWDGKPFDRILADVPCTASGIVRRHPDIRWLRRPEDAGKLARQSAKILDNLWQLLKPGGQLLLVTCSLWPEESALQAQQFAVRHSARPIAAPGQLLPQASDGLDQDGLFYALFQKPSV